ncbi:laminin subunit gamma-1 [Lingula anatina]|uniref:Laminin subunit gamma-1 n=1 Tax=Lingula anatina TaxID=7574 RepID=A0A1S3JR56_LINAN|nr:laminin subunit gamma-1 [Lingula anatina]|eukprot:XP_013412469.1 laminin subunit gamma-1 [Lingula anatina]
MAVDCRRCRKEKPSARTSTIVRTMKLYKQPVLVISLICALWLHSAEAQDPARRSSCYTDDGRPQRCVPEFVNAAYGRKVVATNTCGLPGPTEFCVQTLVAGNKRYCEVCDARDTSKRHPPEYLTDFNNNDNMTWWQSETMNEGIQYPNSVNLTLHLGKSYDITYVRLKFHSPRPESFTIYKRTSQDGRFVPYQYYSASCEQTYRKRRREIITRADETKAICTEEYSDISPLTGGNVAFSTLEGRPSATSFDSSPVLQEWVTATDIMITLNRLNTFGDEVFGDSKVLKSYFYAISDFAVGGRCKCNGHASKCVPSNGAGEVPVCLCEHNTAGSDCEECASGFHDAPWGRATADDARECKRCDCNGKSNRCYFDRDLYERTGRGGHCTDCQDNTAGPHCERCKENYFRRTDQDRCEACQCSEIGSESLQCSIDGRCRCKPGVGGDKCDRCLPNYYDFSNFGCRQCQCLEAGSLDNRPMCTPDTGMCTCKETVEGQNCDRCKPGYYNLQEANPLGCISCFCYGHSSVCSSARQFTKYEITSDFENDKDFWEGKDKDGLDVPIQYNAILEDISISSLDNQAQYFSAPSKYSGDQSNSYNQLLSFNLRVGEEGARASIMDIVLEGNGQTVSAPIFAQGNPLPRNINQEYRFVLHEHPRYQWTPRLTSLDFRGMLANLTSMRLRGTYQSQGVGFLDNVKLVSARRGSFGDPAPWVEQCTCPTGYVGQFCESCEPGYHRDPPGGGPYARCIPCNCNNHSDTCEVNTGRCICQHNTAGTNCEVCKPGYYGYALAGTPNDCSPCPCPDGGSCVELLNGEVACINCREGYAGNRCEYCADSYYGDPTGRYGPASQCQKCRCNENIDPNAVANCNSTTGECLKCIYNTAGFYCDRCLPGYYGDALALPKGDCKACQCYPRGSRRPASAPDGVLLCEARTGQCPCLPYVTGRQCDRCQDGYYNIDSGNGCEMCMCDPVGSTALTCDIQTGQCSCKPGVGGRTCDQCLPYQYGFSLEGCKACECSPEGSLDAQCDVYSGQCPCKENTEGRQCDRCKENKYNITAGCIDCPPCYSLVQDRVNEHRRKLITLQNMIASIGQPNTTTIDDTEFLRRLDEVNASVNALLADALFASGEGSPIGKELSMLNGALGELMLQVQTIADNVQKGETSVRSVNSDLATANDIITRAGAALSDAEQYLQNEGQRALMKAKDALALAGQQSAQLTNMSREARQLVEKQEEEASAIDQTSRTALNISQEALQLLQQTSEEPDKTAEQIKKLKDQVSGSSDLYDRTEQLSKQARDLAVDAYNEALDLYTSAGSLMLPDLKLPDLRTNITGTKNDAAGIKDDAETLIKENEELMKDVTEQRATAEELLQDGIRQQQIADELLAEADAARAVARDAVAKGEKTLKDAQKTLAILKDFDDQVQRSKAQAEEAMKKIPDIESLLDEANRKTQQARDALSGAEANATLAEKLALEAKDISEMAATV